MYFLTLDRPIPGECKRLWLRKNSRFVKIAEIWDETEIVVRRASYRKVFSAISGE